MPYIVDVKLSCHLDLELMLNLVITKTLQLETKLAAHPLIATS